MPYPVPKDPRFIPQRCLGIVISIICFPVVVIAAIVYALS